MNVQCHACVGGKSIGEDIRRLDAGVHVVSGTPGRTFDMIRRYNYTLLLLLLSVCLTQLTSPFDTTLRRNLRTRNIKMLVLDEADEMLKMGFEKDMESILNPIREVSCHDPPSQLLCTVPRVSSAPSRPAITACTPAIACTGRSLRPTTHFTKPAFPLTHAVHCRFASRLLPRPSTAGRRG
jgi:hypothetical protein